MMKLYAPFIKEATLRVTMTLRSEGHGGDPSPKLQAVVAPLRCLIHLRVSPLWPLSSLVLSMWPPLASALSMPLLLRPLATPTLPLPLPPRFLLPPHAQLLSRASPLPLLPSPPALLWVPALKGDVRLGPLNLRQFFNLDREVRSVQVCAYI